MKIKVFSMILISCMALSLISNAAATETFTNDSISKQNIEVSEIQSTPRADVIVLKTRLYKGKTQYRRWNETRGYWVDPSWLYAF